MNLYYDDWQKCDLITEIIKCEKEDDKHYWLLLKETIFYPGGGAQEEDAGTINGLKILGFKKINEQVYHCVEKELSGIAKCEVNKKIRERHAQIHSGQHLLCSIINKKYNGKTITHFNNDNEAIAELALETISENLIKDVEDLCNEYIRRDLPINFLYPSKDEAAKHVDLDNLSEENVNHDALRAVVIGDIDYNLCGCIHVNNLRYLQALKIIRYEKTTRGYRIYFVVGQLLREWMEKQLTITKSITQLLSSPLDNVIENITNLLNDKKKDKLEIANLQARNTDYLVRELANQEEEIIIKELESIDNKQLAKIGLQLLKTKKLVLILAKDNNYTRFYFGKQKNNNFNLSDLVNKLKEKYEIKGGGNPIFVQGNINAEAQEIIAYIQEIIA